jgi:Na+-translocating ferredoxin:NAD+ oxidoreductase RnfG subunit/ferredoxin
MAPASPPQSILLLLLGLVLLLAPPPAAGQGGLGREFFEWVLPHATEYSEEKEGRPPVFRGYTVDEAGNRTLVGYAFFTSDVPPEELGYNGPIEVLVGMDLSGTLTGVVVTHYNESLQETRGDFLFRRGFQEQFAGKSIRDAFRVRRDVDGISGATITVSAMSIGIRNAARRVASVYLTPRTTPGSPLTPAAMAAMGWQELVAGGLVAQVQVTSRGLAAMEVSLVPVPASAVGEALLGDSVFHAARERLGGGEDPRDLYLVGVDGGFSELFRPQVLSLVQGDDTTRVVSGDAAMMGAPRRGGVAGQLRQVGLVRVGGPFDPSRPFTMVFDLRPGLDLVQAEHGGWGSLLARRAVAAAPEAQGGGELPPAGGAVEGGTAQGSGVRDGVPGGAARPGTPSAPGDSGGVEGASGAEEPGTPVADGSPVAEATPDEREVAPATIEEARSPPDTPPGAGGSSDGPLAGSGEDDTAGGEAESFGDALPGAAGTEGAGAIDPAWMDYDEMEEETALARTLAGTSWLRFGLMAALLGLTVVAFVTKGPGLRAVTLVATVVLLGFSGGFLSVSHITSAIKVGPGVFLNDLPLLLLVLFTVVTTLLWGRVFCGFLCPFGALQDALEKVVPRRFRRELPTWLHRRALKGKYGILALILIPAAAGSQVSIFQYFEPFGTVFFFSTSLLLWSIAGAILLASAVVPRFYCRYACPLGAALALGSSLAPFRMPRVEQCSVCRVCENACPTGAIEKERIDFKECVRCNVCEQKLLERAGVCRHEMGQVRERLIQIRTAAPAGGD